jgi:hypothetical protein
MLIGAPTFEMRDRFTRVQRAIIIRRHRGSFLDGGRADRRFARRPLWEAGSISRTAPPRHRRLSRDQ